MAGFLTPLVFKDLGNRHFELTQAVEYRIGDVHGDEAVRVPKGFITDLASIPRLLWNILPPIGSYDQAAVVHDWLYTTRRIASWYRITNPRTHRSASGLTARKCSRYEADCVLLEAMGVLGTGVLTRYTIFLGVRLGGWMAWHAHRKADRSYGK